MVIDADYYEQAQGFARVTRGSRYPSIIDLTLESDLPPPPEVGVLAGLQSTDLILSLDTADRLVESGDYDAAIDIYRSIVAQAPALTSVYLQIGHAFLAKQQPDLALAAYQTALAADPASAEILGAISAVSGSER